MNTEAILMAVIAFIIGAIIAYVFSVGKVKSLKTEKEAEADNILKRAESKANEVRRNAKNEAKQIIQEEREDLEKEFSKRQQSISEQERNLTKKEVSLDQKIEAKDRDMQEIKRKEEILDKEKAQTQLERGKLLERQNDISEKLEKVAGMSKDEAKNELVNVMAEEARVDSAKMIARIEE